MTTETTTNETTATAEAPKATVKKAAKKAAPAKASTKSAKKAVKKVAKASKNGSGPSIRERVFKLLSSKSEGLTGSQIKEKLELSGIPMLLKDEGICDKPRIKRIVVEGVRGVVYQLTALGKKAVEKGTVDSEAAPASPGKEW